MTGVTSPVSDRQSADIAIIGMACLFPAAPDLRTYWENIIGGVSAIGDPPPGWDHGGFFHSDSSEAEAFYCRKGGFLRDLTAFDPIAYGVMPSSVEGAEPEHFLALRVAYEALADAGYLDRPFNRDKAGVILGRGTYINRGNMTALQHVLVIDQTLRLLKRLHPEWRDEELQRIRQQMKASLPPFNAETAPGLVPNVMCGRIANRLDLKGPNYAVDAACASSLIAVDLAVQELRSKRCDLVLAGGVSVGAPPAMHLGFCKIGALSPSQTIRPFDAAADGTILGEGIGIIVLKRLEDAQRDSDRIYAVVKGVGVASDGRALGVLAPRVEGEELALRRAYEAASMSPRTVELVEAHGTGTTIGDLTEIQALRRVFGDREGPYPFCALGSVKSMIGHAIPAAGVAGLIKTALALYHKTLPPTLNCKTPNPKFQLGATPFYMNTETRPWIHGAREPRRAGVNTFGFGGINAHVILEETPGQDEARTPRYQATWDSEVVILQGPTREDLVTRVQCLHQYLEKAPTVRLRDVAYTVNTELRDGDLRLAIVAASTSELHDKLAYSLQCLSDATRRRIKDLSGIYFFEEPLATTGKLAFLFPGEGPQYINMLADLCIHFPEVRTCFDQADRVFLDNKRESVPSQIVFPPPLEVRSDEAALWQIDVAVGSVFAANCGLAALLSLLRVKPDAVVGHSSGEYAALLAAGAVDVDGEEDLLEHALDLNARYAMFADKIPAAVLVAVGAIRSERLQDVLAEVSEPLYVTMDNCPHQVVLCGTEAGVQSAVEALRRRGAVCSVLPFRRGYHTPLFGPVAEELGRFFEAVPFVRPNIPIYSCATASRFPYEPDEIRRLVVRQWSCRVRFRETIEAMYADGNRLFVEVGPGGNLTGFVDNILRGKTYVAVPMNVGHRSGITQLNHAIGLLAAHGVAMDLQGLYARRQPQRLDLERPERETLGKSGTMRVKLDLPTITLAEERTEQVAVGAAVTISGTPQPSDPGTLGSTVSPGRGEAPAAILSGSRDMKGSRALLASPATDSGGKPSEVLQSHAMAEYLRTMERFLEVQQEVMQAFLAGTVRVVRPPLDEGNTVPSRETATVAPAEGPATLMAPNPLLPALEHHASPPTTSPADVTARLLHIVSEKTGYPVEMLDLTLNMEADLGIDSIKRVEILGGFQQATGLIRPEDFEQLSGLKTLQQVIEYVTQRSSGVPVSRVTPPAVNDMERPSKAHEGQEEVHLKDSPHGPFVREILSVMVGEKAAVSCTLDVRIDRFLQDHIVLGRRSSPSDASLPGMAAVPLTISLEMMSEVAALVLPTKRLIGMRDIRSSRWFALEEDKRTVVISATRKRSEGHDAVEVRIMEPDEWSTDTESGQPLVEGTLVFSDAYPPAPLTSELTLRDGRPYRYRQEEYYTQVMFHGPLFQGVVAITQCGEDGIRGTVKSGVTTGFFDALPPSRFVLDPVLLDAAGQLVGFWTEDRFARGFAFPLGFAALHLYAPLPAVEGPVECSGRIRQLKEGRVQADLDCVDATGRTVARIVGWEDMWFDFPREFTRFNLSRREGMLSREWPEAVRQLSSSRRIHCCRFRRSSLPQSLFDTTHSTWQAVLSRLILNRQEYEKWRGLTAGGKRRTEWLLGRLVGKDAVRLLLTARDGLHLSPAEIEIAADEYGAPVVRGAWTEAAAGTPSLTLAHSNGVVVGVAAECGSGEGIGIDVEALRDLREELIAAMLIPEERALLARVETAVTREWMLRLWCAKEALGKALGVGLMGGPRSVVVRDLNLTTGAVSMTLAGPLARTITLPGNAELVAYTLRDEDLIVASALAYRGEGPPERSS
jgi:acyl transferase domain-containing protein/phosphopantetheinyl transferase